MKIKTKILDKTIPTPALKYAKEGDAGIDLTATSKWYDKDGNVCYGTNRAFEIPKGYVGLIFPRSSNSKKDLLLSNSVGVVDSGYRGEVKVKFKKEINSARIGKSLISIFRKLIGNEFPTTHVMVRLTDFAPFREYDIYDRVAQLIIIPYPTVEFEEVDELSETERGAGGYGSTGK